LFGKIVAAATCRQLEAIDDIADDFSVELSDIGELVNAAIKDIPQKYEGISVDSYVIMPNHIHLIIVINDNKRRQIAAPTVSTIIGHMKRMVSLRLGFSVWQRSFHDHIIRSEGEYLRIFRYIENNPANWGKDCFYLANGAQ
jgi:REP element-mobilizing transposase RayT